MLRQRIITAIILAPLMIISIVYLPTQILALVFAGILSVAAWEWATCIGWQYKHRILYVFSLLLCVALCSYLLMQASIFLIVVLGFLWWHIALLLVIQYQKHGNISISSKLLKAVIGGIILVPCWLSIMLLHARSTGVILVLFLCFLIWLGDSAAYFAGKRFAKKKLAGNVSPGKSWEGVYGALLMTFILALHYIWYTEMSFTHAIFFIVLALFTLIFSIVGDLVESMFKRMAGMKDSGSILPGHGGVLDRIDSLTAAAPVFCVGIWLMEQTI